jgi:hypothetical protein
MQSHPDRNALSGDIDTKTKPHGDREKLKTGLAGEQPNPQPQKTWLVEYAVTDVEMGMDRTLTDYGLVEAQNITEAEDEALRGHVPEGFSEEGSPFAPEDSEYGCWTTMDGLRAFELSDRHASVDAGSILWIKRLQEVDAADAPVVRKYIERMLTYEQKNAENQEQKRLRAQQPNPPPMKK